MPRPEKIFSIRATVLAHSVKAVKIRVHDEEIWIPKSQMFDVEDLQENGEAEIKMSQWIADKVGLNE